MIEAEKKLNNLTAQQLLNTTEKQLKELKNDRRKQIQQGFR